MTKNNFTDNFLWGASTSAYQFEGAYNEDGKGLSVQDVKKSKDDIADFKVTSDHYHHVDEDIELLSELGLNAYRFSIAWTRIIPDGVGEVNPKGIEFYRNLIDKLLAKKIEPIVTLYHFDLPYALEEKGGWQNRETIDAFANYADILFREFGDKVKYWLTINEQNMMVLASSAVGAGQKTIQQVFTENHHMLLAQAKVLKNYHEGHYPGKIGPAPNIAAIYPASSKAEDILASEYFTALRNWAFLDPVVYGHYNPMFLSLLKKIGVQVPFEQSDEQILQDGNADFIAFNYYASNTVAANDNVMNLEGDQQSGFGVPGFFKSVENSNFAKTEFGWEIDPVGFRITADQLYSRYHLPLLVTENGIGTHDELVEGKVHDQARIDFISEHLKALNDAIADGTEIIGYSPWSAIDLVSTHEGFKKRYGFVYVNRTETELLDLKRIKKDSFDWYKKVAESNGDALFKE